MNVGYLIVAALAASVTLFALQNTDQTAVAWPRVFWNWRLATFSAETSAPTKRIRLVLDALLSTTLGLQVSTVGRAAAGNAMTLRPNVATRRFLSCSFTR